MSGSEHMFHIKVPRGWEIPERNATPEGEYLRFHSDRRSFLRKAGLSALSALLPLAPVSGAESSNPGAGSIYPAKRNPTFTLERPLTDEKIAARVNNFYEFSTGKDVYRRVDKYQPIPWEIEVKGMVRKPGKFDLDQLLKMMPIEERLYRLRCVEAWAMAVPWTGFQFSEWIKRVEPAPKAKYVRFVCLNRPDQCPGQREYTWYPWPYYEALRLDEAMNELVFMAVGIYGHDLPKQHGAPLRLAVPWKYGYKSPKAIVRIEFTDKQPATFWSTLQPSEYPFESNVNPAVPHPRWSQATERMVDTGEARKTVLYNGYGQWVAGLYP